MTPLVELTRREIRRNAQSGGTLLALGFFAMAGTLLPLGLGPDLPLLARTGGGLLWMLAALAALLSLDRLFAAEADTGALEWLALSPVPLEGLGIAKIAGHWLTTGLPLVLLAAPAGLMFGLPVRAIGPLMLSLALGTPALSAVGAIGAALVLGLKRGGLLLPLIVLPLIAPAVIFGGGAAQSVASGWPLLAAFTILALLLAPFAVGAALRRYLGE